MNFNQWYIKYRQSQGMNCKLEIGDVKNSWEACKEEVLKILQTKESFMGSGIKSTIDEIEQL